MKITLTHEDVLAAVRESLIRQGFNVPASDTGAFVVFCNADQVVVEVDGISIAIPALMASSTQVPAATQRPAAGRFDPPPSPPRERRDTPDRSIDDLDDPLPEKIHNERSIKGLIAQSQEMVRRIPEPSKVTHQTARDRFPRVQVSQSIEDFGKDPTDFADEV